MASNVKHSKSVSGTPKPEVCTSPRHKLPEAHSNRIELQPQNSPDSSKPQLRTSPRFQNSPKVKRNPDIIHKEIKKKRKAVVENETESSANVVGDGLRLHKCGCVSMHRIVKRKINGHFPTVLFNDKGQPYGAAAAEMQSYIGVLVRTKVPIWFDTWKQVPLTIKNKIWKSVTLGFDIPPSARKLVLQSANSKWKQFKSTLTCKYILPFRDEPEKLRNPPLDFSFLEKNHWDMFIADRLSPEFLKIHDEHVKRVKENKYPHRLSRKGYANLEQEWAKSHNEDDSSIDRSASWVLARKDKEGNFKSESTRQKAEEIISLLNSLNDTNYSLMLATFRIIILLRV